MVAVEENKLAECADPVPFRQRAQWHRKKLSNAPEISNLTARHRHAPVAFGGVSLGIVVESLLLAAADRFT